MAGIPRFFFSLALMMLTVVSIWTTYVSLKDSILPEPVLSFPVQDGTTINVAIFAFLLAFAIGLMLMAMKWAIIDGQKRLGILGIIGLFIVGFISISFNIDVLYRISDRDFMMRHHSDDMRAVYETHFAQVQQKLQGKIDSLQKNIAVQEAELQAEIEGLRKLPSGYGSMAKEEDYKLRIMASAAAVEIETLQQALLVKQQADQLLAAATPRTYDEIQDLQAALRAAIKDASAAAGVPLPEPVSGQSPIFAVFAKLADWRNLGMREIFIVLVALFLDLGDIIGYSLVPQSKTPKVRRRDLEAARPQRREPQYVEPWDTTPLPSLDQYVEGRPAIGSDMPAVPSGQRPFRIRRW